MDTPHKAVEGVCVTHAGKHTNQTKNSVTRNVLSVGAGRMKMDHELIKTYKKTIVEKMAARDVIELKKVFIKIHVHSLEVSTKEDQLRFLDALACIKNAIAFLEGES